MSINATAKEAHKKIAEKRQGLLDQFASDPFMGFASLDEALDACKFTSQAEVLARLFNRENVFVSGLAGAGKSTVIKRFVDHIDAEFKGEYRIAITASTGVAANLIGGRTIHAWAGLGVSTEPFDRRKISPWMADILDDMRKTDVLIIDEISMMPAYLFTKLDETLKYARRSSAPFGGIQLILLGDFLQLPPVSKAGEEHIDTRFAIETDSWKEADIKYAFLDKTHRSTDARLKRVLAEISMDRVGPRTRELIRSRHGATPQEGKVYTTLFTTNRNVEAYNNAELDKNPNTKKSFRTFTIGDAKEVEKLYKQNSVPKVLDLKVGATVMLTKNISFSSDGKSLVNGSIGKVIDLDRDSARVRFNNGTVTVLKAIEVAVKRDRVSFVNAEGKKQSIEQTVACLKQIPLKLAYAITVHKSQGSTLDGVVADLSNCFQEGLGYVALSRVRTLDDLIITGFHERAYTVGYKSLKISQFTKKKALLARKEFLADRDSYESLLENFLIRMILWPEGEGGNLKP